MVVMNSCQIAVIGQITVILIWREVALQAASCHFLGAKCYLSVREAARLMGVSERSVYGYVETGKLPGARIGNIIVVVADYVEAHERKAPGRIRTTTPPWHMPPPKNLQFLTTIIARIRPGQGDRLEDRLYEIRASKKHRLLGTAARYIARNEHDPDEIEIVLIWRSAVMPSVDVRENALAAFYDDLSDIIDWGTISRKEGRVLMHA
jgi:excisionase family DNA binding protein